MIWFKATYRTPVILNPPPQAGCTGLNIGVSLIGVSDVSAVGQRPTSGAI
jgi:hypothetical protein